MKPMTFAIGSKAQCALLLARRAAGAAMATLLVSTQAIAAYTYEVFDVPGASSTYAYGLNERGDAVGYYDSAAGGGQGAGFSRIGGVYADVLVPGGIGVSVGDIDSAGNLVGGYVAGAQQKGFQLTSDGTLHLAGPPGALVWRPSGLNDQGQESGLMSTDAAVLGYVWDGLDLITISAPGASFTDVRNVNASGQMVGTYYVRAPSAPTVTWYAYLYESGSFTTLTHPAAGTALDAFGINDAGDIVGDYQAGSNVIGFIRHADGRYEDVMPPGAVSARVQDISNSGQLVGYFYGATGGSHGFIATLVVPEPGSVLMWLCGLGVVSLLGRTGRRHRSGRRQMDVIALPQKPTMPFLMARLYSGCLLTLVCLASPSAHATSTHAVACGDVFGDCVRQDGVELAYATHSGDRDYGRSFSAMAEGAVGALRAEVRGHSLPPDAGGQEPRSVAGFDDVIHFTVPSDVQQFEVTVTIELDGYCIGGCVAQLDASFGRGLNGANLNLFQAFPAKKSATLLWNVRDTMGVSSFLDVRCRSIYGDSCTADFSHTGTLTLTSSTPGVTAIGESGHNYAPVPEPKALLLMLLGIAVLLLRGLRSVQNP